VKLNASHLRGQILGPLLKRELVNAAIGQPLGGNRLDPAKKGYRPVRKISLSLWDRHRDRAIAADLYYAQYRTQGPLVVMSHGFAADRRFLAYLAQHLASHGITVVAVEHPGSNIESLLELSSPANLQALLPAAEFIDRPKDISFVLNELNQLGRRRGYLKEKFNTREVTVIGHSFGGYTGLALAGAVLDPKQVRAYCRERLPLERLPADWLQCAAAALPYGRVHLRDRRIKQVIALNPIVGQLFGEDPLAEVDLPVLMLTSSEDGITPTLAHQLRPFRELRGEKFLLAAIGATHMSVTDISNFNSPAAQNTLVPELLGEEAEALRHLVKGLSLAFILQRTPRGENYEPFLSSAYVETMSTQQVVLRLSATLPNSIDTWLNALNFGDRPPKEEPLVAFIGRARKRISTIGSALPSPAYCSGSLNQVFTSLLNSYHFSPEPLL
ncbi:MAG: alpha/beta fold hydrolase, partial [Chloroflexaceae bacterium]|nr:alpha/beta fold hydrolase [Chloroflexaceae bacterium]